MEIKMNGTAQRQRFFASSQTNSCFEEKEKALEVRQNMLKSEENFYLDYQTTRFQFFYKPPWKFPKMLTITERMSELNDTAREET